MSNSAIVAGLYLGRRGETSSGKVDKVVATFEGFVGDRHYGYTKKAGVREKLYPKGAEIRNNRQISIVSVEELDVIASKLGIAELNPEWLGANILTSGIPQLTQLPALSRLVFEGGAVICVYGENLPCVFPGEVINSHHPEIEPSKFPKMSIHLRGLVGWVESPGTIEVGESIELILPR